MPTPLRNFRCPDATWAEVLERAQLTPKADGTYGATATDIIIAALDAYLQTPITPLSK